MTIVVSLLRPLSRGSLTLKSANALDFPLINMNYLDHPLDAVALREGVRFVDEIVLRGDGMKDIIIGEYPEGDGGIVKGTAQADGTSDGVYGAKKGERDEGKSVEGHAEHMLGLDTVRDSDEGMAQWLKGRVTSGYRKSFFLSSPFSLPEASSTFAYSPFQFPPCTKYTDPPFQILVVPAEWAPQPTTVSSMDVYKSTVCATFASLMLVSSPSFLTRAFKTLFTWLQKRVLI
jgi:hypothetical protein